MLWLVDRVGGSTRVRLVRDDIITALPIGSLAGLNVSTFSLSPGGSRYAVTADGDVYVGMIQRSDKNQILRLTEPQPLAVDAATPTSAVWASRHPAGLSSAAARSAGRSSYIRIDSSAGDGGAGGGALLPDVGADILVLGAGDPPTRYATDTKHRVWYLPPDGTWHVVKSAEVTGLTYGR